MLKRLHIKNYKALRDLKLELTPIHVLIGPNDSGKTSILEAIAALSRSVDSPYNEAFLGLWKGASLVWQGDNDLTVKLKAYIKEKEDTPYELSCKFDEYSGFHRGAVQGERKSPGHRRAGRMFRGDLAGVQSYRWVPGLLSLPVAPNANRRFRMESSGFGLAMCLDDILGDDRKRFAKLETQFRKIFPQVRSIKLKLEPAFASPADDASQIPKLRDADGKGVYIEFTTGGEDVAASQISDGMLLILAYLAILYLPKPPRFLLVEEPENGLHPGLLRNVISILRDIVKRQENTQVILTTHSPYVIDLFKPNEVTLCNKNSDGSISVQRLSKSKTVREQIDIFTLGEIWTAEGDEALTRPIGAAKASDA